MTKSDRARRAEARKMGMQVLGELEIREPKQVKAEYCYKVTCVHSLQVFCFHCLPYAQPFTLTRWLSQAMLACCVDCGSGAW